MHFTKMIRFIDPNILRHIPRDPVSINTLSKDTVLEIGSHLGWNDKLSLLQVNHQLYKSFAEDWFVPTHYEHDELWCDYSTCRLSFLKLYEMWKAGDSGEKEGIEKVFMSHQFWPGIELFLQDGSVSKKVMEQFLEQYVYLVSDEILEALFMSHGPFTHIPGLFKLAVQNIKSPRTLYNLMEIIGLPLFMSMEVDNGKRGYTYKAGFHLGGCLIKHGIVRSDIISSLLSCYDMFAPPYLPRILSDSQMNKSIKLNSFTKHYLNTSNLITFETLKLFFSKFPDYRLFLKKKGMMTRWSGDKRREILRMNVPDWCTSKGAFEMALSYFKDEKGLLFVLEQLDRVDSFVPSKKSINIILKAGFSEIALLNLIKTFPKIRFTSQHVQMITTGPSISANTMLQVFQRAPGVYPVVDLDPLGINANPATLIEFSFLFPDRLDSLVYLMRHKISESYLADFLKFCHFPASSIDRIRSASEEFGYSDQFVTAFKGQCTNSR